MEVGHQAMTSFIRTVRFEGWVPRSLQGRQPRMRLHYSARSQSPPRLRAAKVALFDAVSDRAAHPLRGKDRATVWTMAVMQIDASNDLHVEASKLFLRSASEEIQSQWLKHGRSLAK